MPVPPQMKPNSLTTRSSLWIWTRPLPKYVKCPIGPLMSIVSPMFMLSRCCDILPPVGNLGCTFAKYTLMTKSKYPTSSSPDVGVYARMTGSLSMRALTKKWPPTGRPRICSLVGSEKRKRRVSCESTTFSSSRTATFLRGSRAFGLTTSLFESTVIQVWFRKSSFVMRSMLMPWLPACHALSHMSGVPCARGRADGHATSVMPGMVAWMISWLG
mmetsp:Transcript_104789/g.168700  ORF Transcript_104789/g.168700 Transcript_104789/m.168700 type:complete len:215 (-) Transcript_104789:31-675(-)